VAFFIIRSRRPPPKSEPVVSRIGELEAKKECDPAKFTEPSEFPGDSQVYESPGDAVVHEMDTNDKRMSKYRHVSELDAEFPLSEPPPLPEHEPGPDQVPEFDFMVEPGHSPEPDHILDPDVKVDPDYEVDPDEVDPDEVDHDEIDPDERK